MRNKILNNFSLWQKASTKRVFIFMTFVLIATLGASQIFAGDNKLMSVDEAKRRIAAQQGVDEIPKKVWKKILTPQEYKILWRKGTEKPFTGELLKNKRAGVYVTAGCGIPVFRSNHKFKSGTGWPSFWEVYDKDNIKLKDDRSWGMKRTEVLSSCGEHLGHVFDDGPDPTGLRYCINSVALKFIPQEEFDKSYKIQD